MNWGVVVFEVLSWLVFVGLLAGLAYASYRNGRVLPGLWMVLGILSMSWLEAPIDNAGYAQFHPDFHRLPAWGPIGMTQGQLPVFVPPSYTMYFLLTALGAVAIARVLIRRYGLPRVNTLLLTGLVFGALFDLTVETMQAQYLHLWVFTRIVPGPSISSEMGLVPAYAPLAMGTFIMGATYVLGNVTATGDSVIDVWAKEHTGAPAVHRVLQAVGYAAFCNVLYLVIYLAHAIPKYLGMVAQAGVLEPFPGRIAVQPESGGPQAHGALGAVILWGMLWGTIALTVWWAKRADRRLIAPSFASPLAAAQRDSG